MGEEFEILLNGAADIFGAKGLADIRNCLSMIVATRIGSTPLYREFGTDWAWVDVPEPHAMARFRADIISAVEKYEPRVRIISVSFRKDRTKAADGRLSPLVRFRLAEGVSI